RAAAPGGRLSVARISRNVAADDILFYWLQSDRADDEPATRRLWGPVCRLYDRYGERAGRRESGAGRQRDARDPPLRSRTTDSTDPVQNILLLGGRLHSPPA